jgi:hypothetical protein
MNTPLGFKTPNSILGLPGVKINSLHPFGCLAWLKVPEANQKKLDPKALASILLSYLEDGNGYRLWDLEHKTVVKSRDVLFDHKLFPYNIAFLPQETLSDPVIVELPDILPLRLISDSTPLSPVIPIIKDTIHDPVQFTYDLSPTTSWPEERLPPGSSSSTPISQCSSHSLIPRGSSPRWMIRATNPLSMSTKVPSTPTRNLTRSRKVPD